MESPARTTVLRRIFTAAGLGLLVAAAWLWLTAPEAPAPEAPAPAPQTLPAAAQVERGLYLAQIGNCALCHTARGGEAYAGGRAIDTPFGSVVSGNITPDRQYGIGQWSADDFWGALHLGKSRDGHLLSPAFPYTSYQHVTREDSDALFAYLQTVPASTRPHSEGSMGWPFNTQLALWAWRSLYFQPETALPAAPAQLAPAEQAQWQRGAYLVQGLGHCMECHSARNWLGARTGPGGSVLPGNLWYAPSLQERSGASVADWTDSEVVSLLTTGLSRQGVARGPMAEVVQHGTQHLTAADALAMARYLRSLPATPARPRPSATSSTELAGMLAQGQALYEKHCTDCHGARGEGVPGIYPALAGSRTVNMDNPNNLVHALLRGGFAPATAGNPQPFGMPPYMLLLNDTQASAVLSYVRFSWGNTAAPLEAHDINRLRR
jgi:mono/diheme cytochrome c family protein